MLEHQHNLEDCKICNVHFCFPNGHNAVFFLIVFLKMLLFQSRSSVIFIITFSSEIPRVVCSVCVCVCGSECVNVHARACFQSTRFLAWEPGIFHVPLRLFCLLGDFSHSSVKAPPPHPCSSSPTVSMLCYLCSVSSICSLCSVFLWRGCLCMCVCVKWSGGVGLGVEGMLGLQKIFWEKSDTHTWQLLIPSSV